MRKLALIFLLVFATSKVAQADTRSSAFSFNDPGVRASAMGGAFSALGGQPSAMYWNPATLYFQDHRSFEASYASLYGLGLAQRTQVILGWKSVIEEPRFRNDRVVVRADRRTGPAYSVGIQSLFLDLDEDSYSEIALGGGAAWGYGDRLAFGMSLRALFVNSDLDNVFANGYDLGLGLAWSLSDRERIAVSAPHLVSRIFWKFDSTERLPQTATVGWSRQWNFGLLTTADIEFREDEASPYRFAVGGEWWAFPDRLALRGGYRVIRGGLEDINKPTFGAGVHFGRVGFDYSFRLGPELLGDTHRLGVLADF
ncbi:MAG: hypothetical protein HKN21_17020 [Candidatus Eisenbacteria bacterium]|uniref:PorV/PorQ family protein n=1 Tax=Eiseniibacteriota bacterium TaxID=2212470 RepID=A0A7Y2H3W5_UNCEI|nr:hypothetical protein [Candidatus Eisenbacteria bacterium]